jgi:hypothetical protein
MALPGRKPPVHGQTVQTTTRANGARPRHADRPPAIVNRAVLAVLRSRLHGLLDAGLCELRYADRSGRTVSLPVLYAAASDRFVVLVGDAADKRWWRHFRQPAAVEIRRGRQRLAGTGRIVPPEDPGWADAWKVYYDRHHVLHEPGDRLLVIDR